MVTMCRQVINARSIPRRDTRRQGRSGRCEHAASDKTPPGLLVSLHHAAVAAHLDHIEAEIVGQVDALATENFWIWFDGEITPLLETISGETYAYARNRIDRMLRNAKVAKRGA